jgi:acetylornithine aminotransferase/acetylornithine/N-succinyldiaminopimelate aminotransferase
VENSCADRVFFANSGAEANEAAIKLARIYFKKKGLDERYEIITLVNSFHGRTLATVAATGQEKFRKPFQPLLPSFKSVPINDIEALENALSDQTCAIMMEPIQGESGVHPVSSEYAKAVRKLCDRLGILLIFDEVQTGLGRTGKLFGYQHFGIEPDIFTLAKALGGGVPIGAMCAKQFVADAFEPGDHGSTFGGNPLACTAALAVMKELLDGGLVKNSEMMGGYLLERLSCLKDKYRVIKEVRGKGLIIGMELTAEKAAEIRLKLLDKGFVVGNVGSSIIRMLPPLIVSIEDIDQLIAAYDEILQEYK